MFHICTQHIHTHEYELNVFVSLEKKTKEFLFVSSWNLCVRVRVRALQLKWVFTRNSVMILLARRSGKQQQQRRRRR